MNNEFVTYAQALALNELGFDEECFAYYYNKELSFGARTAYGEVIESPLKQQALRWFREKYELSGFCRQVDKKGRTYWKIDKIETEDKIKGYSAFTDTYEEAENACIDKLIEIVKQK